MHIQDAVLTLCSSKNLAMSLRAKSQPKSCHESREGPTPNFDRQLNLTIPAKVRQIQVWKLKPGARNWMQKCWQSNSVVSSQVALLSPKTCRLANLVLERGDSTDRDDPTPQPYTMCRDTMSLQVRCRVLLNVLNLLASIGEHCLDALPTSKIACTIEFTQGTMKTLMFPHLGALDVR